MVSAPSQPTAWLVRAEKLLEYNESIANKGSRIFDLLPMRLERRLQSGAPPISDEFRAILGLLEKGCMTVVRLNGKLRTVIIDNGTAEPEEISENYWERLTEAVEQWQPRLTGSYYLHALLEVAVTANEIKWAAPAGQDAAGGKPGRRTVAAARQQRMGPAPKGSGAFCVYCRIFFRGGDAVRQTPGW